MTWRSFLLFGQAEIRVLEGNFQYFEYAMHMHYKNCYFSGTEEIIFWFREALALKQKSKEKKNEFGYQKKWNDDDHLPTFLKLKF